MRIIVTGCRDWRYRAVVENELHELWEYGHPGLLLVGDCSTGADRFAQQWFTACVDVPEKLQVFPADWDRHGKAAGPIRNQAMVDSGADLLLAFWDGESRGTLDCLTRAVKAGIPVRIIPKQPKRLAGP